MHQNGMGHLARLHQAPMPRQGPAGLGETSGPTRHSPLGAAESLDADRPLFSAKSGVTSPHLRSDHGGARVLVRAA